MSTLTINDLRSDLLKVYDELRAGTLAVKEAKELNNTAGKLIASAKVQIEYATVRAEIPNIEFLNSN